MVNGVEPKSEQNLALGQGVIGYATQIHDTFTCCLSRGQRKVSNTLVLAAQFLEFDNHLRGKATQRMLGNPISRDRGFTRLHT